MNWVIVSWIFVALLTAVNVFVFIKLKNASMQMMKMVAPGAKNMNDAVAQMQGMMGGMGKMGGGKGQPDLQAMMGQMNSPQMQQQMKAAMDMLAQMQKNQKR
jgi:nitrate/nitrite transporter NarK